jgi:hypothetical protein
MGEIFLSYSRQDQVFADSLIRGLEAQNLHVWIDRENIPGGAEWRAAISRAIASCDAFLVVLSPQCIGSRNVVKELSIAESRKRHIIPIMYQPCEIPPAMEYQLAGLQWIDFSEVEFDDGLGRLVSALGPESGKASSAAAVAGQSASAGAIPPSQPESHRVKRKRARPEQDPEESPDERLQPNPEQRLTRALCGQWNVRIEVPFAGALGQMTLELRPNQSFSGQLIAPLGVSQMMGTWQVIPGQQLELTGQQTMGWNAAPYYAAIRFLITTGTLMTGVSAAGESVTFTKIA